MITVAKHDGRQHKKRPYIVYVGRTTRVGRMYSQAFHELSNPFRIGVDGNRAKVVRKYQEAFLLQVAAPGKVRDALFALIALYKEHSRLVLVCHCLDTDYLGGYDCHAQVLGEFIMNVVQQ